MSSARRSGRAGIVAAVAAVFLLTGVFVAVAVVSYRAVWGDEAAPAPDLPGFEIVSAQETVFDYTEDACSPIDIPDAPARAFRDDRDRVHLIASHYVTRALVGPSLDEVRHDCRRVMVSDLDGDPARFDDREWLASPYTTDGRIVHALVHQEYQGDKHAGRCPSGEYLRCWYNSITVARSTNGGRTFTHAPPPRQLVAASPYRYEPDEGPYGLFQPSNIVRRDDGYHYSLLQAEEHGAQRRGTCLARTLRIDDPGAWRAWDGEGFDVTFTDPYRSQAVAGHTCAPVSPEAIGTMTHSLTYNTYLGAYVLVSPAATQPPGTREPAWGFHYSTSKDLVDWTPRKLIRPATLPTSFRCGDPNPVGLPSLLDPDSDSRSFETTGRESWLYFTRYHYKDCRQTLNRDLVRVRVRFSK